VHVAAVKLYIEEGYGQSLTGVNCQVRGVSVHSVCAYAKKKVGMPAELRWCSGKVLTRYFSFKTRTAALNQYNIILRLSQSNRVYMSGLEADFSAQDCQSSRMLQ
jgi:hypothetical protein